MPIPVSPNPKLPPAVSALLNLWCEHLGILAVSPQTQNEVCKWFSGIFLGIVLGSAHGRTGSASFPLITRCIWLFYHVLDLCLHCRSCWYYVCLLIELSSCVSSARTWFWNQALFLRKSRWTLLFWAMHATQISRTATAPFFSTCDKISWLPSQQRSRVCYIC